VLEMVISGGQTGVDQAALRAARAAGMPTGGWAPRGFLTEDGPAPWLAGWGLKESARPGYPARTGLNVRQSDATLLFDGGGPGGRADGPGVPAPGQAPAGTAGRQPRRRGRAGPVGRHTGRRRRMDQGERLPRRQRRRRQGVQAPGVGALAERFLAQVFALLREGVPPC
jgi:hypothetical protein